MPFPFLLLLPCLVLAACGRGAAVATSIGAPARAGAPTPARVPTFTNPLVPERALADPWIAQKDGYYYFTFTAGRSIEIWKTRTISGLENATKVTVWRAPDTGPNVHDVWAPEIHFVNGKWYIYYTATDQTRSDANRRIFALEAATNDPQGAYIDRGKVFVAGDDEYAIDGSVYQKPDGSLFFLWSGRERSAGGAQNIYIAPMRNPYTISGPRVLLSTPSYDWERVGWAVNEGPEVLHRNGKTFLVYSASGGTTPDYALGLLTNTTGNLLDPKAWTKSPVPVFSQYKGPEGGVYTPGHNGFFRSPDGTEDWIVYHGKEKPEHTWGGRLARAQRFTWGADDAPIFGHPVPSGVPLAVPSGEGGARAITGPGKGTGLQARYFGKKDLTDPKVTRLDPSINFHWKFDAPASSLPTDGFSARWRGQVQPRYSETYTFHTYADDGVRVWVDGKLLIDDWADHPAAANRGAVALQAGRRYDIRIDYFDNLRDARLLLAWSSPRQPFEVIPRSQLYPPAAAAPARRPAPANTKPAARPKPKVSRR